MSVRLDGPSIRVASSSDVRECHKLDVLAWGADGSASEDSLRARVEANPAGNFVAVLEGTGGIVGSIWTVSRDEQPIVNWWQASGHARYAGVLKESGSTVFGVSIAVHPQHWEHDIGSALIRHVGELAWAQGKRKLLFGVPMSDFHLWEDVFSAEDYARLGRSGDDVWFEEVASGRWHVRPERLVLKARSSRTRLDPRVWPTQQGGATAGASYDPNMAAFTSVRIGGDAPRIREVLPSYFPNAGSCDFGVLVEWTTPQAL